VSLGGASVARFVVSWAPVAAGRCPSLLDAGEVPEELEYVIMISGFSYEIIIIYVADDGG